MIPWMRDQLAEAWQNRKSSRTAARRSLTLSSISTGSPGRRDAMLMALPNGPDSFSVNVISLEGNVFGVTVKPDCTIDKIKTTAIKHFYGSDTSKASANFRLVYLAKFKQLADDGNVNTEGINKYDELMLVEIRSPGPKESMAEEVLRGPNEETIARVTSGLPVQNPTRTIPSTDCSADFQNEIRKILITLVQASAKILMHSPDEANFYEILKEKLEARCRPMNDPKAIKTLTEMGYPLKKVLIALSLRKSSITDALEWLIEHQHETEDEDDDENGDTELTNVDASVEAGPSTAILARKKALKQACDEIRKGHQGDKKDENLVNIVDLLLESFRQYKKLEFKPSSKIIQSLIDMGFEEKDIIGALKITGNDQSNACEWLLGERRQSLQDLDGGLDPKGSIYKAIMDNPHIQLSLTNPKMLLAYLSMLETPASTNIWINDLEVSPVLSQIFKTYHAEKHAIHMNRYAEA